MESKYYTPDISDFYVGFRYWYRTLDGQKRDQSKLLEIELIPHEVTNMQDLVYIERGLNTPNNVLVKYLDKQDIEELGFVYRLETYDRGDYTEYYNAVFDTGKWQIQVLPGANKYLISSMYASSPSHLFIVGNKLFEGTIKNISELKKVLKMIGVL